HGFLPSCLREFPLTQHRLEPREIPPQPLEERRILDGLRRAAEPQPEQLLLDLGDPLPDLLVGQAPNLLRLHWAPPSAAVASRTTIRHLTGSFAAASTSARRATGSATPSSSNMTRPGFTTATQNSGLPFPFPIRVSAGFLVTGLSGKIRIHPFPPRLI